LERGIITPANVADHVEPHRGNWTDVTSYPSELRRVR
jgi:hypothetical protein